MEEEWQPSSPHQDHPPSLPWKLEEARRPIKGSLAKGRLGPQPGWGSVSGCWSVAKLVCRQPPLLLPALSQWGPIPGSHCFPGSLHTTRATGTTVLTRDPHDCPAHVVVPSTMAPTFDRDLLDLPGFLIDPLLSADFLCGAHEFFEFLNLLSTRKQESTEEL